MKLWYKYRRTVYGTLAGLAFLGMNLAVAAMEQGVVTLGRGALYSIAFMAAWVLLTWLAGGFITQQRRPNKWR